MVWLRSWIILLVLGASSPLPAESPDRHLDGTALANYVTPWILRNTDPARRGTTHRVPQLTAHLHEGLGFAPPGDPARERLTAWMLSRREGNVQDGLMLVWDVLREGWGDGRRRNLYPHILKLVDITGELEQFDGNVRRSPEGRLQDYSRGDNFSAWYHFFGTALHAYLMSRRVPLVPGHWVTNFLTFLEENVLYNSVADPFKRRTLDREGARFGAQLARNLERFADGASFREAPESRRTRYLYPDPERYREWAQGPRPQPEGTPLMARYFRLRDLVRREDAAAREAVERIALTDPVLSDYALDALEKRGGPPWLAFLRRVMETGTRSQRGAAAARIAHLADPGDLAERAAADPEMWVRYSLLLGFRRRPEAPALQAVLTRLQADPVEQVRQEADRLAESRARCLLHYGALGGT
jgi:hypothetical protein